MNIKIFENIILPANQNGMVIDPDLSLVVENLTTGILTIRSDISPDGNSHIALYGNINETNNKDAIKYWVRKKLEKEEYSFISLIVEFHEQQLEIEQQIQDYFY